MTISFRPAKRENVPLLIGLMGGTSSGKTESAMKIATGLAGGERFCVIDTEAGRALHKADRYDFDYAELHAPFTPEAYIDAVQAASQRGYRVIVLDSASHEYDGMGGVLDIQTAEFKRLGSKESARMTSWIEPKKRHRAYVNALLQVPAHIILCHRAEDKIEIVKEGGKTVVRPKQGLTSVDGWIPICERRLPFELTMSILLLASAPGVPRVIKIEDDMRPFVPLDRPLDETVGSRLAAWAKGSEGEPAPVLDETVRQRFEEKVERGSGSNCWLWTGAIDTRGYGSFWLNETTVRAHRVSYELHVGPIPEGLQLDHLCRVRHCVNPAHLQPVSPRENILRGEGLAAKNAVKTHCDNGHEFTEENTYIRSDGTRRCRECDRAYRSAKTRKGEPKAGEAANPFVAPVSAGVVGDPPSPSVITEGQVTRFWSIARARKIPEDTIRAIVSEVAGVESTKAIGVDKYEAVVARIASWEPV